MKRGYTILALTTLTSCSLTTFGQTNGGKHPISQPLVSHIFTADPSAHVFNGKISRHQGHSLGWSSTVSS